MKLSATLLLASIASAFAEGSLGSMMFFVQISAVPNSCGPLEDGSNKMHPSCCDVSLMTGDFIPYSLDSLTGGNSCFASEWYNDHVRFHSGCQNGLPIFGERCIEDEENQELGGCSCGTLYEGNGCYELEAPPISQADVLSNPEAVFGVFLLLDEGDKCASEATSPSMVESPSVMTNPSSNAT